MNKLQKTKNTVPFLRSLLSAFLVLLIVIAPLEVAGLTLDNLQYAAPPTVTGTCQYTDTILWLYDTTDGGNLADYHCWDGVSNMIFDYHVGDSYTLIEMTADGDCTGYDVAGCRGLSSYRGEASFTVGTTNIPNPALSTPTDPPVAPPGAGALWIDHATYTPGQSVGSVCAAGGNYVALFDAGTGANLGTYPCGWITSSTQDGHSYTVVEISNPSVCDGQTYDSCASSGYGVAEVHFSVSLSGGTDAGVSSPNASISKSSYLPNEDVLMTCSFSHNSLALFDTDANTNIGTYPCDNPISFSGIDGHLYALLEITNSSVCDGQSYDSCLSSGYGVSETHFYVSATGDVPADTSSGTPGTNKSIYKPGETVVATCSFAGNSLVLYDSGTNENLGIFACGSPIQFNSQDSHSYTLLEVNNSSVCTGQTYDSCYSSGYASLTYRFSVANEKQTQGLSSYRPEVTISSPKAGTAFSKQGSIAYRATDRNDRGTADERARLGLVAQPVSLYYTDKLVDWDHTLTPLEDMTLVAANQPASGNYQWDTSKLLPGVFYRAVATAIDATGNVGQDVSDLFTVDFEQPTFTVTADPPVARAQDVTISVVSSKDLRGTPTTTVTQQGGKPTPVVMKGSGKEFTGTYSIVPGYDGIATITVEGSDAVGNVGNTIVSGGTFAIGIDPPPKPHILSPNKGTVVASSTLVLTGTTRPDTAVIVKLNGVAGKPVRPDGSGNFAIPLTLSAETHRGLNTISVAAQDQTGATGAESSVDVKYNIPPVVHIASPSDEALVGSLVSIEATSSDQNLDPLFYTYQIISKAQYQLSGNVIGATSTASSTSADGWTTVAERVPSNRFNWDSTEVDDGSYVVRIIADDGNARVVSEPRLITIKNTLPYFRFEDGRKTVTGTTTAIVKGRVIVPQTISPRPVIWNAEYSLDDGKRWIPISFTSGSSTSEATFAVSIGGLREGTQGVRWRVRDSRSLIGKASHPIVFDTTPPKPPVVLSPKSGSVITDADDSSTRKGMQLTMTGRAEAESVVTLSFASTTLRAKAGADGSYAFRDVDIPSRGAYKAALTATDPIGNTGTSTRVDLIYDNPPSVSILQPKNMRALSGKSRILWRISDPDADPISAISLSYRVGTGTYIPLGIRAATSSYEWDVSKFPEDRSYQLKLTASDGIATSTDTVDFSVDRTPPSIELFSLDTPILNGNGKLMAHGRAHDGLAGIEYVEYAISDVQSDSPAQEWYTALVTSGFLGRDAMFSFAHPLHLQDGTYRISVRAVDAAGNTSAIESRTVTVDSSPPRVGSFEFHSAGFGIPPNENGDMAVFEHGSGEFSISLEGDTKTATLFMGDTPAPLSKDIATGLWKAPLAVGARGSESLMLSATDEVGNTIDKKKIGMIDAISRGTVSVISESGTVAPLPNATIEVLVLNERGEYVPFLSTQRESGKALMTDANGTYELALPEGSYRLVVRKDGYATADRTLVRAGQGIVAESFETQQLSGWRSLMQSVSEYFAP